MIKFSIVLLTYNRPKLVKEAIKSILNQTYSNFELIIINNGGNEKVKESLNSFSDKRIKIIHYDENKDGSDVLEKEIRNTKGDYIMPFLGDDDIFTPRVLEYSQKIIIENPKADILKCGLVIYNHDTNLYNVNSEEIKTFTTKSIKLPIEKEAWKYFRHWGIGKGGFYTGAKKGHSSATFFSKEVLDKTKSKQGNVFLKPFGDIGLLGTYFNSREVIDIDLPLFIIGCQEKREMDGARFSGRAKFNKYIPTLKYSPLKSVSFANMGVESHLKVLHCNNLNKKFNCSLRPKFFIAHLIYIIMDSNKNKQTWIDLKETIPLLIKSFFQYFFYNFYHSPITIFRMGFSLIKNKIYNIFHKPNYKQFKDANDFAQWVDDKYIPKEIDRNEK